LRGGRTDVASAHHRNLVDHFFRFCVKSRTRKLVSAADLRQRAKAADLHLKEMMLLRLR
jgi:hypothetical protein